jgi:hypothetical protein
MMKYGRLFLIYVNFAVSRSRFLPAFTNLCQHQCINERKKCVGRNLSPVSVCMFYCHY